MPRTHAVRALQRATGPSDDYMSFRRGWYYLTPSDLLFTFAPHIPNPDYTTLAGFLDAGCAHDAREFRQYFTTFLRIMGSYVCYAPEVEYPIPNNFGYSQPVYRSTDRVYYHRGFVEQSDILGATAWMAIYVR